MCRGFEFELARPGRGGSFHVALTSSNQMLPGLVRRIRSAEPWRPKNGRIVSGIRTGPDLCPTPRTVDSRAQ
jgi:hypothetical protein